MSFAIFDRRPLRIIPYIVNREKTIAMETIPTVRGIDSEHIRCEPSQAREVNNRR